MNPQPIHPEASGDDFKFLNRAPDDKEWTAHIKILNEWGVPDRRLRDIIQYARSGKFYPADMHVDLIEQLHQAHIDAECKRARVDEHFRTHCVTCGKYNRIDRPEDDDICQCE